MNIGKLFGKIGKALIKAGMTVLKDEAEDVVKDALAKRQAKQLRKDLGL